MVRKGKRRRVEDPEPLVLAVSDPPRWRQPLREIGHELCHRGSDLVLVPVTEAGESGNEVPASDGRRLEASVRRRAVHSFEELPDPWIAAAGGGAWVFGDESVWVVVREESRHVAHAVGVPICARRAAAPVDDREPALEQREAKAPTGGLNGE